MTAVCDCCGQMPGASSLVSRRRAPDGTAPARWARVLCGGCLGFMREAAEAAASGVAGGRLLPGAPTAIEPLASGPSCGLCGGAAGRGPGLIDAEPAHPRWRPLLACDSCDAWVGALARDGRSFQGRVERAAEGPTGTVLHPRLHALTVVVGLPAGRARTELEQACTSAGARLLPEAGLAAADLLFAPATGRDARERVSAARWLGCRIVLLAGQEDHEAVLEGLDAGAADWLTVPVTPHQAVAALVMVSGGSPTPTTWERSTALPEAVRDPLPPAIWIRPTGGTAPFAAAWLVRRFSRGYDRPVSRSGEIVLLPHAPAGALPAIAARLEKALEGRCRAEVVMSSVATRFEATG
ncbi:MAG: response regulator transcription factor [Dehalococcoidia bacterium]|nr:response regulator transcription factor [Dehalococcoidia bacterium]